VAAPTSVPGEAADRSERAEPSTSAPDSGERFVWRDHWYPVSLVEDLDPRVPTPFQLLNRDLVIWKDPKTGDWVALDDRCPHRLAPLSVRATLLASSAANIVAICTHNERRSPLFLCAQEGRIDETGCLQCSYHGWSFDGAGACTKIPQAAPEGLEARAVRSPRACATKFPTLLSQGLLFVWPDENGWEKAKATKPPMYGGQVSGACVVAVSIEFFS
jgi:pheophorbide a oxygenase